MRKLFAMSERFVILQTSGFSLHLTGFRVFLRVYIPVFPLSGCQRPYHVERTRSRQLPEVKLRRVPLVLGWVTAWEYGMLLA